MDENANLREYINMLERLLHLHSIPLPPRPHSESFVRLLATKHSSTLSVPVLDDALNLEFRSRQPNVAAGFLDLASSADYDHSDDEPTMVLSSSDPTVGIGAVPAAAGKAAPASSGATPTAAAVATTTAAPTGTGGVSALAARFTRTANTAPAAAAADKAPSGGLPVARPSVLPLPPKRGSSTVVLGPPVVEVGGRMDTMKRGRKRADSVLMNRIRSENTLLREEKLRLLRGDKTLHMKIRELHHTTGTLKAKLQLQALQIQHFQQEDKRVGSIDSATPSPRTPISGIPDSPSSARRG